MTRWRHSFWLLLPVLFLFGLRVPAAAAEQAPPAAPAQPPQLQISTPEGRLLRFTVEVAQTRAERERGLMGRAGLPKMSGMLFVFPREEPHIFWMKDTPLCLDMLFIDAKGRVVGIVEKATPLSLTPRQVDGVSAYVLEIEGGESRRLGLTKGAQVTLLNIVAQGRD